MIYGRSELRRRLKDAGNKGVTNSQLIDLVESLWRDPYSMRTSGFNIAGGTDAQISFTNANRTFSIAPVDKKFSFYQFLHKLAFFKKRDQETVQILDVEGWHMIYYYFDEEDASKPQKLYAIANPDQEQIKEAYLNKVLVAWIYWDFVNKKALYFGDERHGSEWNPQIHWWAHESFNAIRKSGLRITDITIGDGSQNSHALFGISAGSFYHEDILVETPSLATGQNFPLYYFLNGKPRLITNTNYAVNKAGSFIDFNVNASGLANMTDGFYQLVHVFAANCRVNSLFAYMGVGQYPDPRSAGENLISELDTITSLMAQQTRFYIGSVLFHSSSEYTNEVRAKVFGELTPELLTDIISKDNTPFLKTGWSPDVMKQIFWFQNDAERRISISPISSAPYYIEGDKYFLDTTFAAQFADETGLKYISRGHNAWNLNEVPFTGFENHFVFAIAAYYNSRKGYFVYAGWRMHMWEMESKTRGNIIKKTGLEHVSGLEISFVEDEGHDHKINVSDGSIRLADIVAEITDGSGFTPFAMRLRYLEARKHFLRTYFDDTDPENPIVTHEWEFDFVIPANVAILGITDEVLINTYNPVDGWHLEETADGDYSAMWLIGTLDSEQPLKWITGAFASADLDEAKALNTPETLRNVFTPIESGSPLLDYKDVLARVMIKNIEDDPYYELIELKEFDEGEFDKELTDRHVTGTGFDELTSELILYRNANLPELRQNIPVGGVTDVFVEPHPQFPIDFLKYTKGGIDYDVTEIPKANGLIFGGLVSWLGGLSFGVAPAAYYINGTLYTTGSAEVTLGTADPDDPRIDIIVVDTAGNVSVIAGTPAANPAKPTPEPSTQIEITSILVLAGATEPGNPGDISDLLIYDENVEWTGTSAGVTINLDSTTDPFRNSKCADVGAIGTGDTITFTGASAVNKADYETLIMYLNLKAVMSKQHTLSVCCLLAGVQVSAEVLLPINGATTNAWQNISITIASLNISATTFDAIRFRWSKTGAQADHAGFYLDYIKLERGVVQPPIGGGGEKGDPGEPGADGREVELSVVGDYIAWRYVGDASWTNLVALATITGPPGDPGQDGAPGTPGQDGTPGINGKEVELRENAGYVEWRYVGDVSWTQLYQIPEGGGGGGTDNFVEVALDFFGATSFVYNVPCAMKFTSLEYEDGAATVDPALNTTLAKFNKVTITASTAGLVILQGTTL